MRFTSRTITGTLAVAVVALAASESYAEFAPVLSEIMASNGITLADEDGAFSDWIEIHNSGDTLGDLDGWALSDDAADLARWEFPPKALAPGEFIVVFASGKNRATQGEELHTDFKLKSDGEFLALTMPEGTTSVSAFDPSYPQQFPDVSWGSPGYFSAATPGMANSAASSVPISTVDFTPDSQVFTDQLVINLATLTAGTTIIYTTDGSDPNSANGMVYSAPFTINTTTEIRARAQTSDAEAGPTSKRKYLKLAADTQSFSSPLPIVILDNFGGGNVPQRNASTGPNGNDGSGVIQVARQEVLMAIYDRAQSSQASPSDAPTIVSNGGLRVRGSSSAGLAKKSFSLEAWEDGVVEDSTDISPFGLPADSDWVLYAPTEAFSGNRYDRPLLHNSFIYQLSNEIGSYAARTQFVELFLNKGGGELSMADYAGLYIFMEQRKRGNDRIDFKKLSQNGNDGGWMINVDRMDPQPIGGGTPKHFHTPGPNQTLETPNDSPFGVRNRDDLPSFYHSFFNFESPGGYVINTDQRTVIESEMNAFEDALYGPEWKDPDLGYAAHIDVDNFIDHYILQNLTKNQDAYVLSTLLYRDTAPDRIKFGPIWDFDRGYNTSPTSTNPSSNLRFADNRMWFPRLFADIEFEQKYIDRWQELRSGAFATDHLHAIIDAQMTEITEPVALRNGTANWPSKVTAMKNWLATRTAAIDAQFVPRPIFSQPGGIVSSGFELTLNGPAGSTVYYTTNGSDPRLPGGGIAASATPFDGGPVDTELITFEGECRYHIPTDDTLDISWTGDPDSFDDSSWTQAMAGLGWENLSNGTLVPAINTDIKTDMRGRNGSAYFRWEFDFENIANINSITVQVKTDDGFVAYLNGVEIGQFNAPDPIEWNSVATDDRSDNTVLSTPITLDASAFKAAVRSGSNTLAIQGMNITSGGSDFLIDAALEINHTVTATPITLSATQEVTARSFDGTSWSGPSSAVFVVGLPADSSNLVVAEIMYNPSPASAAEMAAGFLDGDQFEFIEFLNIGNTDIDLSGVAFIDGIEFTFPSGANSILAAGERIVVVKNLAAFELRYGGDPSRNIAGSFAGDTNLRDSGEQISLTDINAQTIRDFTYDDDAPWPEAADGDGYSLVLELPETNPDHRLPESWHSSATLGGSPGTSDSQTFTGNPLDDADLDGINHLIEFATGSNDNLPSDPPGELLSNADGTFSYTFHRNLAAAGLSYRVETSTDLLTWQGRAPRTAEINLGDGTALVSHLLSPDQSATQLYVRLRVDIE